MGFLKRYSTKNEVYQFLYTSFLLLVLTLAFNVCDQTQSGLKEKVHVKDSFSIKSDNASAIYSVNLRSFIVKDTVWVSLLDPYSKKLSVLKYNEGRKKVVDAFEIPIPLKVLGRYGISSYCILNKDSVFLIPDNKKKEKRNTIFLIDGKKEVLHKWKFTDTLPNGYLNYELSSGSLTFSDNKLFGSLHRSGEGYKNDDGTYNLSNKLNYLYKYPSHFAVNIYDSSITNPFADYPKYARSKDELYFETPKHALNKKEKHIAFLFRRRPWIKLYNIESGDHLETKKFNFNGYEKALPLNLDKGRNLGESRRINDIKSSRFMSFKAGLNGERYYAVYEYPIENRESADIVKGFSDKKKNVLVFNKNIDLGKIHKINKSRRYHSVILPGQEGFFLVKRKHNEKFTMVYFGG